jgi:hypothetical protein
MALHAISRLSLVLAAVALVGVGASYAATGGEMFSPGALHAGDSTRVTLGGVQSHAALSHACGACHATFGSTRPMAARCLECHTDIRRELSNPATLHGTFTNVRACMSCHTEHLGATASLTRMDGSFSAHEKFGFPLDGAHAQVACAKCHQPDSAGGRFTKAPKTCIGCHAADDKHRGEFGTDCASCHTTSTWDGARFEHKEFPLDHGGQGRIACKTCHTDAKNYKSYTCMGCHEHSPARVEAQHRGEVSTANLANCIRCHAGGRKEEGEGGEGGEHGEREGRRRGGDDH